VNAREAFARLRGLGVPVLRTADAAAALRLSPYAASKALSRLAESELVVQVRHGTWWIDGKPDPYRLVDFLTAPLPSYLSLQTALQLHGMVEQIPVVFYAVSLARTQTIRTGVGTFSLHHITPVLFGGFESTREGVKLATPEKAIFDLAYLSGGRSRLFTSAPEMELPRGFRWEEVERWVGRIRSARGRTLVLTRLERFGGAIRRRGRRKSRE
jgi:predicted transcriptional regulator of viral defense system